MSFRNRGLSIAVTVLALAGPVHAAPSLADAAGRYAIRADGSAINFSISNAAGGALRGGFSSFTGNIRIDRAGVDRSEVDFVIDPGSVGTGQRRIDSFLRSDAVFDTEREHAIRFRSTAVKRTGDTSAQISGRLTARGKTFPETFNATLEGLASGTIRFHVTGKVLRSRYGMDVGTPIYSNVVNFDMTLTGKRH